MNRYLLVFLLGVLCTPFLLILAWRLLPIAIVGLALYLLLSWKSEPEQVKQDESSTGDKSK
jgi:hypothetical protein